MQTPALTRSTLRAGAFRIVVYPNDHRPAHVHVIGQGHEAVFELNCPNGPVELRENYGFVRRDLLRIAELLEKRGTFVRTGKCLDNDHY